MSRFVCLFAVALLAVSVSVSAQSVRQRFFNNSLYCNTTLIDNTKPSATQEVMIPLTNVCTNITTNSLDLFVKASCNSATGVVTVVDYNEPNCTTVSVSISSSEGCVEISGGDVKYSTQVDGCVTPTTASPTTASPTTASPTTASPTTASPTNGTNNGTVTVAPTPTPLPTNKPNTTVAPTTPPRSAASQQASFSLLASAVAAVIVLATL